MTSDSQTIIKSEAIQFSELFRKGRFDVPWHQRYYDWDKANVKALLYDLDEAIKEQRRCYFLGSVMTVKTGDKKWEINDGQQRMVTFALICAALCRRFARETRDNLREGISASIIFDKEIRKKPRLKDAGRYIARIEPPANDRMRFKQIMRGNTIGTNGKLTAAWNEIESFLGPTNDGERWNKFFDYIEEKLEVAWLQVPNDIDPNAVYETINCRGKQLNDMDLIRNYIYSHFNNETETQRKQTVHECLEKVRESFKSVQKAEEYLRCQLQCQFGFLHKDSLYRDVKNAIKEKKDSRIAAGLSEADYAYSLAQQLAEPKDIELYRTLTATTPDPDFVENFVSKADTVMSPRNLPVLLRELRGYKVTQPLLFIQMKKYLEELDGRKRRKIAKIVNKNLNRLATFVLRTAFVAPKFEPSLFENEFSNFAKTIFHTPGVPDEEFLQLIKDCDKSSFDALDDNRFLEVMSETTMKGNSKIKLFLVGINRKKQRDATTIDIEQCTVEHILPISSDYWNHWTEFGETDPNDWIHRIGNLTLLSPLDNKPGKKFNEDYEKKHRAFKESSIALTRDLARHPNWSPEIISRRQREMAEIAVKVWNIY